MELAGKMALVTGASGFIGGHTARRLAIAEHMRVRALLRNPTGSTVVDLRHALIEPVCGDLLEPPSLEAACVGCDLIVHAATDTALTNRRLIRATSVDGTRSQLRLDNGPPVSCPANIKAWNSVPPEIPFITFATLAESISHDSDRSSMRSAPSTRNEMK